ncbi:MAG: peptidoglycan D,D-transpeptidase FtsI family protein [Kiritimatiellia bacterium]
MPMRGENVRFWLPVVALFLFGAHSAQKLLRTHLDEATVAAPNYDYKKDVPAKRGSIFVQGGSKAPMARSVPVWEYHLDPVALTNAVAAKRIWPSFERVDAQTGKKVRERAPRPRTYEEVIRTITTKLGLDYKTVYTKSLNMKNRYQPLSQSLDQHTHDILANRQFVVGVAIDQRYRRQYLQGNRLSHVIGSVNRENVGSAGIEQRFDQELKGIPGTVHGMKDARGNDLYDRRISTVAPISGSDIYLTVDQNLQFEAETALAEGVRKYGAGAGWCLVLDVRTGAVLAMASLPDFHPLDYGRTPDAVKINRAVAYTYEPGSVMKVITAAAAIDAGFKRPDSLYSTDRNEDGYYRLPRDGAHVWDPRMSIRDAIVHSSNIVIGKLGYDFGAERLWTYLRAFGFGQKCGIELPGEEGGILKAWRKWDKASCSRVPIGQGISVTALQVASAYQAIANDGLRYRPYIVDSIVAADGTVRRQHVVEPAGRPIGKAASRAIREMMLDVASKNGTARRAAIRGYSIAGKTGTAQKANGRGGYAPGLYCATFCGIVPSGVVRRYPEDAAPAEARIVVLVSLDFDTCTRYHQGGNSAAPVFKRIATSALRYLAIEPDRPDELLEYLDDDEFDRIMDERAQDSVEEDVMWD